MGKLKAIMRSWGGFIAKHPIISGAVGVGAYSHLTGTNAVDAVMKGGKKVLNFNNDENLLDQVGRTVVDNVTTEGQYDETKQDISDGLNSMKNGVGGLFGGGSGDGTEAGQGGGLMSGLFNGIGNGLKNLMGGLMNGVSGMLGGKLPMLLMLPLAWLAFSKFGWLGKIGGLLLGVFAASSLLHGGQQQTDSRQLASRVADGTAQQRFDEKRSEQAKQDTEEQYTVHMH